MIINWCHFKATKLWQYFVRVAVENENTPLNNDRPRAGKENFRWFLVYSRPQAQRKEAMAGKRQALGCRERSICHQLLLSQEMWGPAVLVSKVFVWPPAAWPSLRAWPILAYLFLTHCAPESFFLFLEASAHPVSSARHTLIAEFHIAPSHCLFGQDVLGLQSGPQIIHNSIN